MMTSADLATVLPRYEFKTISTFDGNIIYPEAYKSNYWLCNSQEPYVSIPRNETHRLREMILVIDTKNTLPSSMYWDSNCHPRTDVNTDLKCESGINVFWISEYMENQFVVSRWLQTAGGNN